MKITKPAFILILVLAHLFAKAQNRAMWVTNGTVFSIANNNDTLYYGGSFTRISPPTGGAVPFSTQSTGDTISGFPKVCGVINAIEPDGIGGWYIGGGFTCAGGEIRNNLAHIFADLSVDPTFYPYVNGGVYTIKLNNGILYFGGSFTNVSGQTRNRVAAINTVGNTVAAWNPNANNIVSALEISGNHVFIGGKFTTLGGFDRNGIASTLTNGAGTALNWNPGNIGGCFNTQGNSDVNCLLASRNIVYAGGSFDTLGGCEIRNHIAAIDTATGLSTSWNPATTNAAATNGVVNCFALAGTTLYAGGSFTVMGSIAAKGLISIDTSGTGAIQNWICNVNSNSAVNCMAVKGDTLFVGGTFTAVGGQSRNYLAAVRRSSAVTSAVWNPNPNSSGVNALALWNDILYAGGTFTGVRGYDRSSIARMNALTGIVDSIWNPGLSYSSSQAIAKTIAFKNSSVFVGGLFSTVHGSARTNLAEISKSGAGIPSSWNPVIAGGTVNSLTFNNTKDTLYAGGNFNSVNASTRNHLAAFRTNLLSLSSWNPNVHGNVLTSTLKGNLLYVGGDFDSIGGQQRIQIASLLVNQNTNMVTAWNPGTYILTAGTVNSIAADNNNNIYMGGNFHTAFTYHFASINASTGLMNPVNPGIVGGSISSMILQDDSLIYIAGSFNSFNGGLISRNKAALIRTSNGTLHSGWNPNISEGTTPNNQIIYSLAQSAGSIYLGGSFNCYTDFSFNHYPSSNLTSALSVCLHPVTVNIGSDRTICNGDTIQLNVCCGGSDYVWSPAASLNNPNIQNPIGTPSSATNYIVNMRTSDGCTSADTLHVTVYVPPAIPSISANGPTSFCSGDSVLIQSTPEYSYFWFPTGETTGTIYADSAADYFVKVTDIHNCSKFSDTIAIQLLPHPDVPQISYNNLTHQLETTSIAQHFQWYYNGGHAIPGDTLRNMTPLASGYFQLCIWDANNCQVCSNVFLVAGIENETSEDGIRINAFPNPFSEKTSVTLSLNKSTSLSLELFDIIGNKILTLENASLKEAGSFAYPLIIKDSGVYLIKLTTDKKVSLLRLVKN